MSRLVRVYRSSKRQEMYLYVDFGEDLSRVPSSRLATGTRIAFLSCASPPLFVSSTLSAKEAIWRLRRPFAST